MLADCDIGDSGARMIREALKENTTLTELNLSSYGKGRIIMKKKKTKD